MHKKIGVFALFILAALLSACGGGGAPGEVRFERNDEALMVPSLPEGWAWDDGGKTFSNDNVIAVIEIPEFPADPSVLTFWVGEAYETRDVGGQQVYTWTAEGGQSARAARSLASDALLVFMIAGRDGAVISEESFNQAVSILASIQYQE